MKLSCAQIPTPNARAVAEILTRFGHSQRETMNRVLIYRFALGESNQPLNLLPQQSIFCHLYLFLFHNSCQEGDWYGSPTQRSNVLFCVSVKTLNNCRCVSRCGT